MQQEAQRDAPDPRETRPPCYSDAIRMPRLDGSFASLNELNTKKSKSRRRKTETQDDENDIDDFEGVPLRRNRCRSEEVISMRSTARTRAPPRIHPFEGEVTQNNDPETSESFEEIRNFDHSLNTLNERSPYAARRQLNSQIAGPSNAQNEVPIEVHDDHFKNDETITIQEREGSDEFITFEVQRQSEDAAPEDSNRNSKTTSF
jgi:hypothetical protein